MILHFAYGANMSRAVMRRHAPGAQPFGAASLTGYRFVIAANGCASLEPSASEAVHGVLWRLTLRDRVMLDAWENIAVGDYRAQTLPVRCGRRRRMALVYIARRHRAGRPKASYMELVTAAAREWQLPQAYVASLLRFLPHARRLGDFAWT